MGPRESNILSEIMVSLLKLIRGLSKGFYYGMGFQHEGVFSVSVAINVSEVSQVRFETHAVSKGLVDIGIFYEIKRFLQRVNKDTFLIDR